MPTYTLYDNKKKREWTELMSYTELEEFLKANPHIEQRLTGISIVAGVAGLTHKPDAGFKEVMQKIAHHHPNSAVDNTFGDKGIKAVKTRQAVERWRKKRESAKT